MYVRQSGYTVFFMRTGKKTERPRISGACLFYHIRRREKLCFGLALVSVRRTVLLLIVRAGSFALGAVFGIVAVLRTVFRAVFAAVLRIHCVFSGSFVRAVIDSFYVSFIIFCHLNIPPSVIYLLKNLFVIGTLQQVVHYAFYYSKKERLYSSFVKF